MSPPHKRWAFEEPPLSTRPPSTGRRCCRCCYRWRWRWRWRCGVFIVVTSLLLSSISSAVTRIMRHIVRRRQLRRLVAVRQLRRGCCTDPRCARHERDDAIDNPAPETRCSTLEFDLTAPHPLTPAIYLLTPAIYPQRVRLTPWIDGRRTASLRTSRSTRRETGCSSRGS